MSSILDDEIGLFMGINSVTETELKLEATRALRGSKLKADQEKLPELEVQNQVFASNSRFGQYSQAPQSITNNQVDSKNPWSNLGAKVINTQNLSADKGQDMGRDNFELKTHALDGQLDNQENTFISFTDNAGVKHEAFRSKNALGVYYGSRKTGDKDWQSVKSPELEKTLEKMHAKKLKDIDSFGGYENYQAKQKELAEINDIKDLYQGRLDPNSKAVLEDINSGKDLNSIKGVHPEIAADLLMHRFDKVAEIIGADQLKDIKANFEAKRVSVEQANALLDKKIDDLRNAAQQLDTKEQAEYNQLNIETKQILQRLEAKEANNPELEKLQAHYAELSQPLDQNQGKYALTQLRAFKAQLTQKDSLLEKTFKDDAEFFRYLKTMPNDTRIAAKNNTGSTFAYITKDASGNIYKDMQDSKLAQKLNPNNNYAAFYTDTKFIIQAKGNGYQAYKIDSFHDNNRIALHYDQETNLTKVFAMLNKGDAKQYQEIQSNKIANINAYKIINGLEEKHYISPQHAESKNDLWELKIPKGEYGLISAAQENSKQNIAKTVEDSGLIFHFDQNANLISIAAKQSRSEGLSYSLQQLNEAKKKAFGS